MVLSWPDLRNPRAHGFFRFFAFETLLLLVLYNLDVWFKQPFSPLQLLSWQLLLASLALAIHGFALLRSLGKPEGKIERTTHLVTQGAYRYIRHPLYGSLLLMGLGACLKGVSLASTGLVVALVAFLVATARIEESEHIERFGQEYREYMQKTKMFIPFIL